MSKLARSITKFSNTASSEKLLIQKRAKPAEGFMYDFYGNVERGFFTFDGRTFFAQSKDIGERDDVVWILIPVQLSSGRIIAWPNFKSATNKLTPLVYHEKTL